MKNNLIIFLLTLLPLFCFSQNDSIKNSNPLPLSENGNVDTNMSTDSILAIIVKLDHKIKLNSQDSKLFRERGMLLLASGNFYDSKSDFEEVIKLNNGDLGEAYFYRALTSLCIGVRDCDGFLKAKKLGFEADWKSYRKFCNDI